MNLRPFVYFSESLVTKRNTLEIILKCAEAKGYRPDPEHAAELWSQAAQSTKSQLQKYQILGTGFKQQALKNWYFHVFDQISPAIFGSDSLKTSDTALATTIAQRLSDPRSFEVLEPTRQFIHDLESNDIQWGIIANDDHLYPLTIKYLGLKPFKIISARTNMFKPLPGIFANAWTKVPAASQHDVWFLADSRVPYDNAQSRHMRTAVYTHGAVCDKSSTQLRIASYDDIYSELGLETDLELAEFDMGASELREFLDLPKNKILERGDRELGLVDVKPKK